MWYNVIYKLNSENKTVLEGRQMRKKQTGIIAAALLIAVMSVSIVHYNQYISQQFYEESTENLMFTYEQVNKTFLMFAQRNWNVLADWSIYLNNLSKEDEPEKKWRDFVKERENWQYSDFYVFNRDCQYWTIGGRQGTAEHIRAAFEELYHENAPIVSSYTSSAGIRKIMFAVPTDPITLGGITYTALAVSYENNVMQEMIGGLAYEGKSDCYLIYSDGTVLMSVEPKTEIPQTFDNLFNFIEENAESYDPEYLETMRNNVPNMQKGSVSYRYGGADYYLVYQPVGIRDWAIVGIVEKGEVDSGMKKVQRMTIALLCAMAFCITFGLIALLMHSVKNRLRREADERTELARRKEFADQLFESMARIVDRFAICDLKNNHYEYHERRGTPLYPETGSYEQLIQKISDEYAVLTDGENAKITNMLSIGHVRDVIRKSEDIFRFEYCARDRSVFQVMNVIPVEWEDGILTKIILVTQDMGQQHELENIANTDALTGLFNKRYFEKMLKIREEKKNCYALFYMDLDRFKPVNDTYGHEMGDKVLKETAQRLQSCIRSQDYAFRMGGDEFAFLVSGNMNEELCKKRIARIKQTINQPYRIDGHIISIGISCGSAVYPNDAADADAIHAIADRRMYEDKKQNRAQR